MKMWDFQNHYYKALKIPSVAYHPKKQGHWSLSNAIYTEEHSSVRVGLSHQRVSVKSSQVPSQVSFPREIF